MNILKLMDVLYKASSKQEIVKQNNSFQINYTINGHIASIEMRPSKNEAYLNCRAVLKPELERLTELRFEPFRVKECYRHRMVVIEG